VPDIWRGHELVISIQKEKKTSLIRRGCFGKEQHLELLIANIFLKNAEASH
jgi:hypothetical protein